MFTILLTTRRKLGNIPRRQAFNISWYVLPAPATIDVEVEMYDQWGSASHEPERLIDVGDKSKSATLKSWRSVTKPGLASLGKSIRVSGRLNGWCGAPGTRS
jgi:hypothetical protein